MKGLSIQGVYLYEVNGRMKFLFLVTMLVSSVSMAQSGQASQPGPKGRELDSAIVCAKSWNGKEAAVLGLNHKLSEGDANFLGVRSAELEGLLGNPRQERWDYIKKPIVISDREFYMDGNIHIVCVNVNRK